MRLASLILSAAFLSGSALALEGAQLKTLKTDQDVVLEVIAPPGTHLNFDGPWKLEVKGALPLRQKSGVFGLEAFDRARERFSLPLERKSVAGETSDYVLTYFFCAEDKSWCRRAQVKGSF